MKPLELTQYRVAVDIGVTPLRIRQIVHGKRAITADTALRLARFFGTTPEIWLRLQARYDLEVAQDRLVHRRHSLRRPNTHRGRLSRHIRQPQKHDQCAEQGR